MKKIDKDQSKVLILCQLFYPELVSTGQTLTELCEVLAEQGVDIKVICGFPTIDKHKEKVARFLKYKDIKIQRVWGTRFPKLSFFGKFINQVTYVLSVFIRMLFYTEKRPIIVVTNPPFLGAICAIFKKIKNISYIYLVFDVYPDTAIKLNVLKENGFIAKLWDRWNRFILKNASKIIVLGRCMEKVILNKGKGLDSLQSKIHIIHVWSDDRYIHPLEKRKNPFIKKWNLNGKFIISYSGNMGRFHDMETIMEAARELRENKNILFLFTGEGYKKRWMEGYATKYKLSNCQFHSYVERRELGFLMACSDIGLVSLLPGQQGLSVPSKTFGILAAGVPVIGIIPKASEIALIIQENNCGFVVEPGNVNGLVKAILNLYSDSQLRERMGNNGRYIIKNKYSLRKAAVKYKALIDSLQ